VTTPVLPAAQITNVGDVITLTGLGAATYTVTVTDNSTLCPANDGSYYYVAGAVLSHQSRCEVLYKYNSEIRTVGGTGVPYIQQWCSAPTTYSNTSIFTVDTVNGTVLTLGCICT
jgi:hypothetical protein